MILHGTLHFLTRSMNNIVFHSFVPIMNKKFLDEALIRLVNDRHSSSIDT